ncbi:MAG: hypothetical protein IPK16_02595 [Anaerolineales bacterium]|nr:hypothetical protein [Anaerolineales bacterium]
MSEDGIIHGFQQRRQLEVDLRALGETANDAELMTEAQKIAANYPASLIQAGILHRLGVANSQERGGLGHLSALLPEAAISDALRAVAVNRQKSPQERSAAALILERYLEEPLSPTLMADLAGNEDIPFQSLLEAVNEGHSNRHILLEYVTQMGEHGVDTAFMVLGLIDRLPPADQVELLRLIAQDMRPQVGKSAVDRLVELAQGNEWQEAIRALHTLRFALPPEPAQGVDRSLRKLQFAGRRYTPPPTDGWRALISPADAGGFASVWLVRDPEESKNIDATMLGFVLSTHAGIVQFTGVEGVPPSHLPAQQAVGSMVTVRTAGDQVMVLLNTDFEVGRWLVWQCVQAGWRRTPAPRHEEYALYNDWVWQFQAPHLPDTLNELWLRSADPAPVPDTAELAHLSELLLSHPAMDSWAAWARAVWVSVESPHRTPIDVSRTALVGLLLKEIARLPDKEELVLSMHAGLRVQSLWFAIAGDERNAERAATLAAAMLKIPLENQPFVATLLDNGLQTLREAQQ